jgi:hypothetical protein
MDIMMELPEIFQGESRTRLLQGTAFGAIATIVVGFYWGGWHLGSTATQMSRASATQATITALAPICVDRFQHASGSSEKLTELKKVNVWERSMMVEKGGWASFGGASADSGIARACADLLSEIKT